jgi:hypothetical protein
MRVGLSPRSAPARPAAPVRDCGAGERQPRGEAATVRRMRIGAPLRPARLRGRLHPAAWLLLLLALLLTLALLLPPMAATGRAAAPPPAPKLEPLPAALARRMDELVREAERYRGLTLLRRVPWGRVSEADLRREVVADFHEDLPPERLAAVELSLKAFGLIPEAMDLKTFYPELLSSQIAGFYDPHRKVLAVVDRPGGLLGKEAATQFGADAVRKMEDGLLVHELTHAIQDQHFDLDRLSDPDPLSDGGTARLALVEGDASLVMFDELVQTPLEQLPEARNLLGDLLADAGGDGATSAGMRLPGEKEMAAAPAWFRDMLLFSYSQGAAFCLEVRKRGGQKLLDYAFAIDPPRSSEQILHPEKWYGHRDDPITIAWPDLGRDLPGYVKAAEGQLGEEGIRILLRPLLPDAEKAAAAAAGWGGDHFAVYQRPAALNPTGPPGARPANRLLAWIIDWDNDEAAGRFHAAASRLGPGWTAVRAAPRRVTILRGDLGEPERTAVLARLAGARAEPPPNHDIDLAHLAARPAAGSPQHPLSGGAGARPPAAAPPKPPLPAPPR